MCVCSVKIEKAELVVAVVEVQVQVQVVEVWDGRQGSSGNIYLMSANTAEIWAQLPTQGHR